MTRVLHETAETNLTARGVAVFVKVDENDRILWQVTPSIDGCKHAVTSWPSFRSIANGENQGWPLFPMNEEEGWIDFDISPRRFLIGKNKDYIAIIPA